MEGLFSLVGNRREREFVKEGIELCIDAFSNVLGIFSGFPFIGTLIKTGIIGFNYQDVRFIHKVARFLDKGIDIPKEEKDKFLNGLSEQDKKKLSDYLISYLYDAEDDEKVDVLGLLYRERVYGRIDNVMFLRLCSIVNRAFVLDLKELPRYTSPYNKSDYISCSLDSYGLLSREESSYDEHTEAIIVGDGYILNDVGKQLYRVLKENNWFHYSL